MNIKSGYPLLLVAGLVASPALYAADAPGKQDTITVVAENAKPDDVVSTIALPESAAAKAVEQSKKGLDTANAARELGREFGQNTAEQAGADNPSTQMREAAAAAREAASSARSDAAETALERRPVTPGKP